MSSLFFSEQISGTLFRSRLAFPPDRLIAHLRRCVADVFLLLVPSVSARFDASWAKKMILVNGDGLG
jgi:hypothetical protein